MEEEKGKIEINDLEDKNQDADSSKIGDPDDDKEQHSEPLESETDTDFNRDKDGKSLWGCRSGYTRPIFGRPNKYQICYHGQWWTMTCPSNAFYNRNLQVCVINYGGEFLRTLLLQLVSVHLEIF